METTRSVRELSGEFWAEVVGRILRKELELEVETLNEIVDILTGVLARHIGERIVNDDDIPAVPLPTLDQS